MYLHSLIHKVSNPTENKISFKPWIKIDLSSPSVKKEQREEYNKKHQTNGRITSITSWINIFCPNGTNFVWGAENSHQLLSEQSSNTIIVAVSISTWHLKEWKFWCSKQLPTMYVASFDLTYQVNTYQDLDYVQCTYVSISVCTY